MSTITPMTESVSVVPGSYDTTNYSYASVTNPERGYTGSDSTTYAVIYLKTGSSAETYIYYNFDLSSIPVGATIDSISCTAKADISTTSTRYVSSSNLQLFCGTTAKGSPTSSLSTSATVYTLTCGTWTRDELQNARIRVYAKRGTSSTSTSRDIYFYGASLSITYTYNAVTYTVIVNNTSSVSVTPLSQDIESGGTAIIQAESVSNIIVLDNDVDVTSQFVLNSGIYEYTLSNITVDHIILVSIDVFVYFKRNNSWVRATSVWKKVNGVWIRYYDTNTLIDSAVIPNMEFPFCNNSLTENLLILSDNKKLIKGN